MAINKTISTEDNAISRRLEHLEASLHTFFEESDKPLLRWLTDPGDEEIVNVFITYEQETGELTELVMETNVPFEEDGDDYSLKIIENVTLQYREIQPALAEEGITMDWVPPETASNDTPVTLLIRTIESLFRHHEDIISGLALFLRPGTIKDAAAFSSWVDNLIDHPIPSAIRFVLLDPSASPLLATVAEKKAHLLHSEPLRLDYPGMLEELAHGDDNRTGPDVDFRVLLVRLTSLAQKNDLPAAEETARQALAIATTQNWFQMQVTVYMMMGACYLQAADHASSLSAYGEALQTAQKAKEAQDPAGPKMEIITMFSTASIYLVMDNLPAAVELYVAAAPLAEAIQEQLLVMEAWRMAAYCCERQKDLLPAYNYGLLALEAGEKLSVEQRSQSTLAYVGDGLIRVVEAAKKKRDQFDFPEKHEIDDQMEVLLGGKWQEHLSANKKNGGNAS